MLMPMESIAFLLRDFIELRDQVRHFVSGTEGDVFRRLDVAP